jgi:hypothetical protein
LPNAAAPILAALTAAVKTAFDSTGARCLS